MTRDATSHSLPCYRLAVVMERSLLADRWDTEKWETKGVLPDPLPAGSPEQVIFRGARTTQFLFPGLELTLRRDEAEGYYLNITSRQPKVFILWRKDDEIARPRFITVSFSEGARWMDSGEHVDGVSLPVELLPWIGEFVEKNYQPEPEAERRYASSKDKGVGFQG